MSFPNKLFGIPNFEIDDVHEHEDTLKIIMSIPGFKPSFSFCTRCNKKTASYSHGVQARSVRDLKQDNKLVDLYLKVPRFRCAECGSVSAFDVSDIVGFKEKYTKRLKFDIQQRCLKQPFLEIGEHYDMAAQSVKNVFMEWVAELDKTWLPYSPRVLGIDEVHLGRRKNRVVDGETESKVSATFTDIERRGLLELTNNRGKETVKKYLASLPDNEKIEVAVIDMWRPYREAVYEVLPNAAVVVDRFHVVRLAVDAMDAVRIALQKQAIAKINGLMSPIRFYEKNGNLTQADALRDEQAKLQAYYNVLKSRTNVSYLKTDIEKLTSPTSLQKLENIFHVAPEVQQAHELKEAVRRLYMFASKKEALSAFAAYKKAIPKGAMFSDFRKLGRTIDSWSFEIFNYYEHPVSNGLTESLNNLIKSHYKSGRGYNFDVLRAKVKYKSIGRVNPCFVKMDEFGKVIKRFGRYSNKTDAPDADVNYYACTNDFFHGRLDDDYHLIHGSYIDLTQYMKPAESDFVEDEEDENTVSSVSNQGGATVTDDEYVFTMDDFLKGREEVSQPLFNPNETVVPDFSTASDVLNQNIEKERPNAPDLISQDCDGHQS